jgi:hypothetical protein
MIIPTTIVDDFLEDPDSIRAFALKQNYISDPEGNWPGMRSDLLSDLNPRLFEHVCKRIFSLFWDVKTTDVFWDAYGGFQRVTKEFQQGWVHQDNDDLVIAIIYLTPNANPSTGTSIYRRKDITDPIDPELIQIKKRGNVALATDTDQYQQARAKNNSYYEETLRCSNVYNRLFVFDASQYHGVPAYDTGGDERLTLTLFVRKLGSIELSPTQRFRRIVD